MYYEHFGLNEPPFKITPDTRLFYTGGNRGAILDAIVYAITSGEGIVKVVGEVGSGKTMLCRMLEVRLPESVEVVYLANPSLSPENILHAIAFEMRLPVDADANRLQVMQALQDRLLGKHADDRQVVVFVEEAQSMPLETLEEIRLLSNLETQRAKLLQIVLFGQPELEPNLSEPHIRQLRERITHSFDLPPFSKPETKEYLDFRMRAAGYRGPEVFSPSAVRAITNASMGLIRRTNILADKSLLAAYAAGVHRITGSQVKVALKDSEFGRSPPRQFSGRALAAGIFLPVLVGGGYLLGSGYWSGRVGGEAAPAPAVAIEAPVLAGEPIHPPPSPISTGERQMVGPVPPAPEGQTGVVLRPSEAIINVIEEGDAEPGQQSVTRNQPTVETWIASGGATGMATEQQINPPPGTVAGVAKQRIAAPAGEGIKGDQEVDTAAVSPGMIASVAQETAVAPAPASHGKNKGAADVVVPKDVGSRAVREPLAEDGASSTMVAGAEIPVENRVNNTSPVAMDGLGAQPVRGVRQSGTLGGVAKKTEYGPRIGGGEQDFLEYRLMETRHWLQRADGGRFSIQLMLINTSRADRLEDNLRHGGLNGKLDKVYVYRTRIRGKDLLSILLGDFSTYLEARRVLDGLPHSLRRARPFVRNISDIRGSQSIKRLGLAAGE